MHIVSGNTANHARLPRYVAISLVSALIFISLMGFFAFNVTAAHWELSVGQWLQSIRTPWLDTLAVSVTMAADWPFNALVAICLVVYLGLNARYWLALHLTCVCLSANVAVPLIKNLTERARPEFHQTQLDSFSFPSGHSCIAALSAGVIALLLAQNHSALARKWFYVCAACYATLVAATRVYLSVHWTTDVIAGLSFAGILLPAFAWQLHTDSAAATINFNPLLFIVLLLSSFTVYALLTFDEQLIHYGFAVLASPLSQ